jgi:predicted nucleotidyltransferase
MDAGDLKAIAEKIAKWADAHSFVHHITLFGSLIRGEESFSDLDVFLEVSDWRKLSEHDRQDWKQQCFMTDYDSLRSQFEFPLDIITEEPQRRAKQTRSFLDQGMPLPELIVGKVSCVWTKPK